MQYGTRTLISVTSVPANTMTQGKWLTSISQFVKLEKWKRAIDYYRIATLDISGHGNKALQSDCAHTSQSYQLLTLGWNGLWGTHPKHTRHRKGQSKWGFRYIIQGDRIIAGNCLEVYVRIYWYFYEAKTLCLICPLYAFRRISFILYSDGIQILTSH